MPTREPELYKDKVEVSLDGRQIFYLFFGGSVVVGIVFVLGVLVGRRVEARGHVDHAQTHSATDPLAALDRLEGSGGLSFQGALTGGKDGAAPAPAPVEKTIEDLEGHRAAADKPAAAKPAEKVAEKPAEKVVEKPAEKVVEKPADKAKPAAEKPADGPVVKPEADKPSDKPADEPKTRYTLQLSAFQDRTEAQAFLDKMKDQGYQASITQAEVEGKGTYYRVRLGTYKSMDAANKAKTELESAGKSATVMKL